MIFGPQDLFHRRRLLEIGNGIVDIAWELMRLVVAHFWRDLRIFLHHQLQKHVDEQIGIRIGTNGAQFKTRRSFVALRQTDNRRSIVCRNADIVRRFEIRIEPSIAIDRAIGDEAKIARMVQNAIDTLPTEFRKLPHPCWVEHEILAVLRNRYIRMHSRTVDLHQRLRQKTRRQTVHCSDLTRQEFVDLNLVAGDECLGTAIIELKLRRRYFGVVFFVFEAKCPLCLGKVIDKELQRRIGQRVEITPIRNVLKPDIGLEILFGVDVFEQKPLDFECDVTAIAFLEQIAAIFFEQTADIAWVWRIVDASNEPKDHDFARTKYVARQPSKTPPVDVETQIRFALLRKSMDRRSVERQPIVRLFEELLVVIEHVKAPLEVGKTHRHRLELVLVVKITEVLFAQKVVGRVVLNIGFGLEIELFERLVWYFFKIPYLEHRSPYCEHRSPFNADKKRCAPSPTNDGAQAAHSYAKKSQIQGKTVDSSSTWTCGHHCEWLLAPIALRAFVVASGHISPSFNTFSPSPFMERGWPTGRGRGPVYPQRWGGATRCKF